MCGVVTIFGQAIHGLIRKRPASMPAALRVSGCQPHPKRQEDRKLKDPGSQVQARAAADGPCL
jgi:hypothetical protein